MKIVIIIIIYRHIVIDMIVLYLENVFLYSWMFSL